MRYIEAFLEQHPADMSLRDKVLDGLSQDGESLTPLMFFANEFAVAGSIGLQMLATAVTDRGVLDQDEFTTKLSEQGKPEFNAIVWGSLLIELDKCLADGVFDIANVVSKINSLTENTGLPGLDTPRPSAEMVKRAKIQEMKITHEKDPTDALFFHEPYHLPNGIRRLLTETGFFSSKDAAQVVEEWRRRAEILLGIPTMDLYEVIKQSIESIETIDEL
jgi:hypothetical protein